MPTNELGEPLLPLGVKASPSLLWSVLPFLAPQAPSPLLLLLLIWISSSSSSSIPKAIYFIRKQSTGKSKAWCRLPLSLGKGQVVGGVNGGIALIVACYYKHQ